MGYGCCLRIKNWGFSTLLMVCFLEAQTNGKYFRICGGLINFPRCQPRQKKNISQSKTRVDHPSLHKFKWYMSKNLCATQKKKMNRIFFWHKPNFAFNTYPFFLLDIFLNWNFSFFVFHANTLQYVMANKIKKILGQ